MKILVINSGSSSLKYEIFDMQKNESLAKGCIEKIWLEWSIIKYKKWDQKIEKTKNMEDHWDAIKEALDTLMKWETAVIKNVNEIDAIWHRIVHWWEKFSKSTIIDQEVLRKIEECCDIAPLHNPANLKWILACEEILWKTPQIAVFDTAFHQSMEKENFLYPIPYEYYEKYKIRKYWFHWTSHNYVSKRACEILDLEIKNQKIITCHIWNWASITAIKNWKVIDTSMWMTPLAWLMMWTRSWDIDPAIIWFISSKEKLNISEVENILNKKSWLLWISNISSDMREVMEWEDNWNEMAILAVEMYINKIIKYIWSYIALMWWLDVLVFTAGIWENSPEIREKIINKLSYFGMEMNGWNKGTKWIEKIISTEDSKVKIIIVPTQEEYMIAMETFNILKK